MLLGGCIHSRASGAENRIWLIWLTKSHDIPPSLIMSTEPSTSASQSNYPSIFNAALENYKHKTKKDLASHPLLPSLQSSSSPEAILTVLREQIPAFRQSENGNGVLIKWVTPTVNVLYSFSDALGQVSIEILIKMYIRKELRL